MGRHVVSALMMVAAVALLSPPARGSDVAHGAIVAKVRCSTCHFLHRKERKIGPGLLDVYGRAPSISGVPFKRWDAHALNMWLSGPRKVKANTMMMLPPLSRRDREDVIAYLRHQTLKVSAASASPVSP